MGEATDKAPSRTQQMRAEVGAFMASHGRSLADMYVVVEERAERRGFRSGMKAMAWITVMGIGISAAIWYWVVN